MIRIFDVFTIVIASYFVLGSVRRIYNKRQSLMDMVILVIFVMQVLPICFELFADVDVIKAESLKIYEAMTDDIVTVIYDILTMLTFIILAYERQKEKWISRHTYLAEKVKKIRVNNMVYLLISLAIFIPIIFSFVMAPNKSVYLTYSYFYTHQFSKTSAEYLYHISVINNANLYSLAFILVAYFLNPSKKLFFNLHIVIGIVLCTWLDGKRGFFIYAILGILVIDYIKNNYEAKFYVRRVVCFSLVIICYFVLYTFITGKGAESSFFSEYTFYFSRLNAEKLAIYDKLYENRLLQYNFQSLLYDLLFWIPRSVWSNKPVMYCRYFTGYAYNGDGSQMLTANLQVNMWAEFISNIGILGHIVAIIFIIFIVRKTEKSKNLLAYYSGMAFILLYLMFGFESVVILTYTAMVVFGIVSSIPVKIKLRIGNH